MPVYGLRPDDVVVDAAGNVQSGATLTLHATQADAEAGTSALATVTTAAGRWSADVDVAPVWVRTPNGAVYQIEDFAAKADVSYVDAQLAGKLDTTVAISTFVQPSDAVMLTAPRVRRPVNSGLVSGMQAGHGFVSYNGTLASLTDDTTDFMLGSQSLRLTTKTDNSAGSVQKTGMVTDFTGKVIRLALKVDDLTNLTELIFYASDAGFTNYWQWSILDAGGDAQHLIKGGEWAWVTLPWNEAFKIGSPTRTSATTLRLRARSTTGTSITVRWNAVAVTPEDTTTFPNGVVSFTYDDSLLTHYTQARPALDKYGWVGTSYTICDLVGTGGLYMDLDHVKALHRTGWEVGAHSYTLADHATAFQNMTAEELHDNFRNMRRWLTDNGFTGGDHLAYPQGGYNATVLDVAAKYFVSARTVNRRMGESVPPGDPLRIRSTSVSNTDTVAGITAKIDAAKANKSWLCLTFHDITPTAANGNQFPITDHQAIVDYCATVGVEVLPVGQVLRRIR